MSHPPPEPLVDFARRLLRHEAGGIDRAGHENAAFLRSCDALNRQLSPLISSSGFQTLLARAIRLAARDFPFLARMNVRMNSECTVAGLPSGRDARQPQETAEAFAAVLAHFMWLVVIFIGEDLGLRKVREIWPAVPLNNADSSSGADE
jgi:hypothetical protein